MTAIAPLLVAAAVTVVVHGIAFVVGMADDAFIVKADSGPVAIP